MIKPMFQHLTNAQLKTRIRDIFSRRIEDNSDNTLFEELNMDTKTISSSSGMSFLNRRDLLKLLYTIIYPEIILIDNTPAENLALYINYPWSIPELKTRYNNRLRGDL
jgi:hypothetical protein